MGIKLRDDCLRELIFHGGNGRKSLFLIPFIKCFFAVYLNISDFLFLIVGGFRREAHNFPSISYIIYFITFIIFCNNTTFTYSTSIQVQSCYSKGCFQINSTLAHQN